VRVQSSGSRPPFFFLHAEYGGDGFYCFNVARHLGDDQPFFGLSPFGRDGERVPETIDAMASAYLAVVRGQQPEGPYVLGGFCAGAVVAWEMACQLSDLGVRVSKLVLVEPPSVECGRLTRAAHTAGCVLAKALALSPRGRARMLLRVVRLARLRHLPVTAANLRGLPAAIGRSLVLDAPVGGDRRADIAAHYSRAVSAYIPRPFDGPVLCLQADDEPNKPALAVWRRHSSNLTSRGVPGDHNSCIVTHARALAHALTI
jgi:thioesterase domain-containing protein